MKIVLVRHGRPDEGHVERPHDPPLSAEGRHQALTTAMLLAREGIDRIVTSPLLRARQTAEPLAERLGLAPEVVDGWAEADRNLPVYRSVETLKAQGQGEWQRFLDDPVRYVGGDPQAFRAAVLGALEALVASSPRDAHVAVYSHGLVINLVLSHALGLERIIHFPPSYGSVTRLRARRSGAIGIVSVNETAHMAHRAPLAPVTGPTAPA
jgi:probable phosphoglycerate mutase